VKEGSRIAAGLLVSRGIRQQRTDHDVPLPLAGSCTVRLIKRFVSSLTFQLISEDRMASSERLLDRCTLVKASGNRPRSHTATGATIRLGASSGISFGTLTSANSI
jgi:hypothetical protein